MNIQTLLDSILALLNEYILPTLITIAFVSFIWNATRYFIFESTSEEGHKKAKSLTLWSIIAFVVISSLAGIINLFVKDIGFFEKNPIQPDYMCEKQGGNCADKDYQVQDGYKTGNTVDLKDPQLPPVYDDGTQTRSKVNSGEKTNEITDPNTNLDKAGGLEDIEVLSI